MGFEIRWYGVMYALALAAAWWAWPRLQKYRGLALSRDEQIELLAWVAGGVVLGGRLGYVLFYEPAFFLRDPVEIFALWHGGMSSHGGILGVALALWMFARVKRIDFWQLADVAVVPAALGLSLGRMGNFINQELYGTVTNLPWGVEVPGAEGMRHPVQIYATMKDLLIAGVLYWHLRGRLTIAKPPYPPLPGGCAGRTAGLFLILYGLLRFGLELLREQEWETWAGLSRGQWLTVPLILLGIAILRHCVRRNSNTRC